MSCAECGKEGGASLKVCKACMSVKYCNAACQMNHWPKHKKECKLRAAELRDEALFKDPPPKEDCPICFLPMPAHLICCVTLPPANRLSVPIFDYADAHEELADFDMFHYYECCGKSICIGCVHSFIQSGNNGKCPFCNAEVSLIRTDEEQVADVMKRVEANDAGAICELAHYHHKGYNGVQQDQKKAMELYARAADLGSSMAHYQLGSIYEEGGSLKKAKFHFEASAISGHEIARFHLGLMEGEYGNIERAVKHWAIAASGGQYLAMHQLTVFYEKGYVSRESIDSFLTAFNNSCAEMRSEARDAVIRDLIRVTSETNESTTATRRGGPDEELAHLFASIYHASSYRPL